MDSFVEAVFKTIERYSLLTKGEKVVVALSGGPDSVALLLVLLELQPRLEMTVEAAHVNHLLRGRESDQDEEFVRALCGATAVPLHVRRIETQQLADAGRQNLEECARRVRYDFLLSVGVARQATVATGHTLNDLSETFLLKLFRGAGVSGLAGIYPRRRNQLEEGQIADVVRPLLDSSRSDILDYLERRKQVYRQDSSNRDLSYDRNVVRHELIPLLEGRFNPGISRTLGRTALLFRELEDFLSPVLDQAYDSCRAGHEEDAPGGRRLPVTLHIPELVSKHPFVRKEVVRRALKEYRGDLKDISYRHVEDILKIAVGPSGAECHPGNGMRVRREFDLLRFGSDRSIMPFEYKLSVPGDVYITEVGKRLSVRRITGTGAGCTPPEKDVTLLDFTGDRLRVRNRRPGDRYRTGQHTKKLKQILIEKRIPRSLRDELLILDDGREILWVEGLEPSPEFRPQRDSGAVLEIRVELETFLP